MEPHALHAVFTFHRLSQDILTNARKAFHNEIRIVFGKLRGGAKIYNIIYKHKENKFYFQ